VELLTTATVIGLVVGVVVLLTGGGCGRNGPRNARMRLLVRVQSLDNAATIYKMSATGNRFYPGQDANGVGALTGEGNSAIYPNCQNAGSALLARCLFTDPNGEFPVSAYGTLGEGMLDSAQNPVTGVPYSILDLASKPMAILYYPARTSGKGMASQFVIADNARYTAPAGEVAPVALTQGGSPMNIQTYVQSPSADSVHRDGEFIITAAGTDRLYFSTSSVNNFSK